MSSFNKAAGGLLLAASALVCLPSSAADKLSGSDASMLKTIAQSNMAEIETAKIALDKSQNAEIKKFAQMMIEDHTQGLTDTQRVASAKGVELPDGLDVKHKAVGLELKALSGNAFDSQYLKRSGLGDHETTEKLLKKTQADAKDPELKALATKMLPVVQGHLQHARQMASSMKK